MTDALTTQTSVEEWVAADPPAQVTQVGVETWVSVGTTTIQALATIVAIEEWVRLDSAVARQYAVSVIT
jgi:hypothetical protein